MKVDLRSAPRPRAGGHLLLLALIASLALPVAAAPAANDDRSAWLPFEPAADSFKEETQADRAIVLITDGEDHEGNPLSLVGDLKKQNIRVYAVGVGTAEGELIPDDSGSGFVKDREGNVVKSALHEDVLGQLAIQTDGAYVRSAAGDFGLDRIFDEGIAQLKRDEQDARMIKAYEDRFTWPLGLSILALAAEAALSRRKLREDAP